MRDELKYAIVGALLIAIVGALVVGGEELGISTDMTNEFIQTIPGLFVFVVGVMIITQVEGVFLLPGVIVVGLGIAVLMGTMDDMGYITTQMKSGLTIEQIQIWTMVIATIAGGLASALTD